MAGDTRDDDPYHLALTLDASLTSRGGFEAIKRQVALLAYDWRDDPYTVHIASIIHHAIGGSLLPNPNPQREYAASAVSALVVNPARILLANRPATVRQPFRAATAFAVTLTEASISLMPDGEQNIARRR